MILRLYDGYITDAKIKNLIAAYPEGCEMLKRGMISHLYKISDELATLVRLQYNLALSIDGWNGDEIYYVKNDFLTDQT